MLFLSYSRQQLYFAESLTLRLQGTGHEVWFDLQQLKPGIDWQIGIQEGLKNCDSVVFVASRAAVASPYVQIEWEHALADRKPVYVVVFEDCVLPPELVNAATILDFRRNFDYKLKQLLAAIADGEGPHDPISPPNALKFPIVLEPEVQRVASFLVGVAALVIFTAVIIAVYGLTSEDVRDTYRVLWARNAGYVGLVGMALIFVSVRFLYRQIGYRALTTLWTIILVTDMFGLIIALSATLVAAQNDDFPWSGVVAFVAFCTVFYFGHRANNEDGVKSEAILRWMPKGVAGLAQREQYNRVRGDYRKRAAPPPTTQPQRRRWERYYVHHHPFDRGLAHIVQDVMGVNGHILVQAGDEADYHIVLVTRFAKYDALAKAIVERGARVVPVVVANVMHRPQFKPLLQYQVVDYRKRDPRTLQRMASYLANPSAAQSYGMSVTPERFDKKLYPSVGNRLGAFIGMVPWGRVPKWAYEGAFLATFGLLIGNVVFDEISNPPPPRPPTAIPAPTLSFFETSSTQQAAVDAVLGSVPQTVTVGDIALTVPQTWRVTPPTDAITQFFGAGADIVGSAVGIGASSTVTVAKYVGDAPVEDYLTGLRAEAIDVPTELREPVKSAYRVGFTVSLETVGWVFVVPQEDRTLLVHAQSLSMGFGASQDAPVPSNVVNIIQSIE